VDSGHTVIKPLAGRALASAAGAEPPSGLKRALRDYLLPGAAIAALHAGLGAYLAQQETSSLPPPTPKKVEIEILRKPPEPPRVIEPPKPPPPPPKQVKQAPPPPPKPTPALHTAPAEAHIPAEAITVPENTQAPKSSEPPVAAAPEPPAPPPPPPKVEEPVTEATGYASYLKNPPPDYPAFAQRQGWEGTVLLHVHVLASGKPDKVDIKQSSGRKTLDEAAVSAVRNWTFAPSRRGNTPIDGWATVPIEFKLSK
jgi:protein TonB